MTLRAYVCGKKKRAPRGAASRVAEYLDCDFHRATQYIYGLRTPDAETARRIQDFIHGRTDFSAKKCGPAKGWKKLDHAITSERLGVTRSEDF